MAANLAAPDTPPAAGPPAAAPSLHLPRPRMRDRVRRFLAEYGVVGIVVYLTIHLGVFLGAWAAIEAGWRPRGVAANTGAVLGAYLFTSLTKIPRFAVTVVVTPFVARAWERVTGRAARRAPAAAGPVAGPLGGPLPDGSAAEQPPHLAGERGVRGDGAAA